MSLFMELVFARNDLRSVYDDGRLPKFGLRRERNKFSLESSQSSTISENHGLLLKRKLDWCPLIKSVTYLATGF